MPNISERKKILDMTTDYIVAEAISDFLFNKDNDDLDLRNLFNDNNSTFMLDDDEMFDNIDEQDVNTDLNYSYCSDNDEDLFNLTPTQMIHIAVASSTYLESKGWGTSPTSNYMSSVVFNLPEKEFKQDARMTYEAFYDLVDKIKNDQVFQNNSCMRQAPVREQLIVALYRFGMYGNGASTRQVARHFGIRASTSDLYVNRVITALLRHRTDEVYWPTPAEKRNIKETIQSSSGFPNCIGCVDGTGIVLSHAPVDNEEDFFNRKSEYSLASMVVVDPHIRIRYATCGFVGSAYDTRVWNNSDLALNAQRYFDGEEYLLGDKGYPLCKEIITPYKEPRAQDPDNKTFNFCLSSPRVRVEHAIGVLKGHFQSLRGLRIVIGKGRVRRRIKHEQDTDEWFDPTVEEEDEVEDYNEIRGFNANFADADIKREYIKSLVLNFNSDQEEYVIKFYFE
ncbi:hypothetical protein INT45_013860 [Circinella minor]|uniref:DDE Tnp4 domain-containing protein n=1 Tax=Circinella minor TaxID=1195481 RepID=A0A8H7VII8_9FUNG|nr:hypothetical protein INT45_013860 [Circinella minor]